MIAEREKKLSERKARAAENSKEAIRGVKDAEISKEEFFKKLRADSYEIANL